MASTRRASRWERWWRLLEARDRRLVIARTLVVAVVIGYALSYVLLAEPLSPTRRGMDAEAYWLAAERLRAGESLYLGGEGAEVYRYAPWFAWAWVLILDVPRDVVLTVLQVALFAAIAWLTLPLLHSVAGVLAALIIVPQVVEYAWVGNVDAFVLVALALHGTRVGPFAVGIAASLKVAPLSFVLVYLAQRQWLRAVLAAATFVILWAPIFLYDVGAWATTSPTPLSPFSISPLVGIAVTAMVVVSAAVLAWRQPRHAPLAAAAIAMIASPRLHLYNIGYLLSAARR